MPTELDPMRISEIQNTCALRFDGYGYVEATQQEFPELNKQIKEALRMYEDPLKNFAVFFALQRFLCKWGGEQLTKQSSEHVAFDMLYLHLYQLETPQEYVHPGYEKEWCNISAKDREDAAEYIRKRFAQSCHE